VRLPFLRCGRLYVKPGALIALTYLFAVSSVPAALAVVSSAVLHEAGHLTAARICSRKVERAELSVTGAGIYLEEKLSSYASDAFISISGCAVNAVSAIASYFLTGACLSGRSLRECEGLIFFFLASSLFAAVNLIPVRGLDGGDALFAVLALKLDLARAEKISRSVSAVSAVASAVLFIIMMSFFRYNVSLLVTALSFLFDTVPLKK